MLSQRKTRPLAEGVRGHVRHEPEATRSPLFERHDDKGEINSFYFSPEAVTLISDLLESLGATVCEPPQLTERFVLLVGDGDVRTNLRYRQETFSDRKLR